MQLAVIPLHVHSKFVVVVLAMAASHGIEIGQNEAQAAIVAKNYRVRAEITVENFTRFHLT